MWFALKRARKALTPIKEATMAAYVHAQHHRPLTKSIIPAAGLEKAGECFWGTLCLLLFMALGPFSAPIVLGYIFFGKIYDPGAAEPDQAIKH